MFNDDGDYVLGFSPSGLMFKVSLNCFFSCDFLLILVCKQSPIHKTET